MPIEKKVVVGALNITVHPHTPDTYVRLFNDLRRLNTPVNIRGDQFALVTSLTKKEEKGIHFLSGDIFKYTQINTDEQWFNFETNDFASADEIEEIDIPENLKPNSSRFSFIFYPATHILFYEGYYQGKKFTPLMSESFFRKALNLELLNEKYGKVEVTHVPEQEKVEEILKLHQKEVLSAKITRPNPDTFTESDRKFLKRMNNLNVSEIEEVFIAQDGKSIEIDNELRSLANLAAKNGELSVKGKGVDGKVVRFSTKDHPFTQTVFFNIGETETYYVFMNTVARLAETEPVTNFV